LILVLLALSPSALALPAEPNSSLSIWTLTCAGISAMKASIIHEQVHSGLPDIFVLTNTRGIGDTLQNEDWRQYHIRESKHEKAGVILGVRNKFSILDESEEIEGLEGRSIHLTVKIGAKRKGKRLKIFGLYLPPSAILAQSPLIRAYSALEQEMRNERHPNHWILAGDLNTVVHPNERQTFEPIDLHFIEAYSKALHAPRHVRFDWWETRERSKDTDYTRRKWGNGDEGRSIVDRIASSDLFSNPTINNRPDLRFPHSDHIWVHGTASIDGWSGQEPSMDAMKEWIERRIKIPKPSERRDKINQFQHKIKTNLDSIKLEAQQIASQNQFDETYHALSQIITSTSTEVFGHREFQGRRRRKKSPAITFKAREIRRAGKMIYALRTGQIEKPMGDNPFWGPPLAHECIEHATANDIDPLTAAKSMHKSLRKELHKPEKENIEASYAQHQRPCRRTYWTAVRPKDYQP
jgi:hypothetical protein